MKHKNSKPQRSPKTVLSLLAVLFFVLTTVLLSREVLNVQKRFDEPSKAAFISDLLIPARNVIVYEPPVFGTSSTLMTASEVAQRFSVVLYGHNQMKSYLAEYKDAGYNGDALLYLVADDVEGPMNLSTVTAQGKTCSENGVNPNTDVLSSSATMDTGDFCEIHDAIVYRNRGITDPGKICLTESGFTNICPTESFFVHKSDNIRVEKKRTTTSYYQPNPGDSNWQKYFTQRVLRELVANYQPGYDYVPGIDGLFIDNLELSWTKLYTLIGVPKEYSTSCKYVQSVRSFAAYVHSQLHSNGRTYPVWANMISDTLSDPCSTAANSWIPFDEYLEGGMDESFVLNWGNGPYSQSHIESELAIGSDWVKRGNHFMSIIQADGDSRYNMYAFSAYLLTTDGVNGSYRYADTPSGRYAHYFSLSETTYPNYDFPLGPPVGDKYLASSSPDRVWAREFKCGEVSFNMTKYTGSVNVVENCTPTAPTPTPSPTPTPTTAPIQTQPVIPGNIVLNPNFESGTANWSFYSNSSGSFTATGLSAYSGSLSGLVSISTPGTTVNLYQGNLSLYPNTKYRLNFAARSNTGHDVKVVVDEQNDDYTNYGLTGFGVDLTTDWKVFSVEFTTSGFSTPVSDARMRFSLADYDAAGDIYSIDAVSLSKVCGYGPYTIPGKVESENFDCGGQNTGYYDSETSNLGKSYRTTEGVDITATSDIGGGYYVGWASSGEWLKYKINVDSSKSGLYDIVTRISSPYTTGKFRILIDGVDVSGSRSVPNTGGWQNFQNVTIANVNILSGLHTLQFKVEGYNANFNYLQFNKK